PKPADKHFPASAQEVDSWVERINEVSSAITEFLSADEQAEEERLRRREAALRERERANRMRVVERYDPAHFKRFEDDKLIEQLLRQADEEPKSAMQPSEIPELTNFERIALQEAERLKKEGNKAFLDDDMERACELYTCAINMNPVDGNLQISLRNNRAQASLRLQKFKECVEDVSAVLQKDRHNLKARLRRAAALAALNRPIEAMEDVEKVLVMDHTNTEARKLKQELIPAAKEQATYDQYCAESVEDALQLTTKVNELRLLLKQHAAAVAVRLGDDGASKVMATDADRMAAEEKLAAKLCEAGSLLDSAGARILFRLRGSTEDVAAVALHYLKGTEAEQREALRAPSVAVLVASVFRVLSLTMGSTVALQRGEQSAWVRQVVEAALNCIDG
ncbi:MAG: hypothetical protein Q8J97_07850, partial [Flavobacteriaceae bacterium]|nr:hypothetical protein [Flavobacteriaceae bacterium]